MMVRTIVSASVCYLPACLQLGTLSTWFWGILSGGASCDDGGVRTVLTTTVQYWLVST